MPNSWKYFLTLLLLTTIVVWISVFSSSSDSLKIISCNVGQGDATLVIYKSFEILVDGGPNDKVLECLSKYLPFWDRHIEVVVLTHPQADHFRGLISVFDRYKVGNILANSLDSGSQEYGLLKKQVVSQGVEVVNPTEGLGLRSGMIRLDILHPTDEFLIENYKSGSGSISSNSTQTNVDKGGLGASDSKLDPNEFSIVVKLTFGSFKSLFTGDSSDDILDRLASGSPTIGENSVNYIKIPHHGSRNSLSEYFYSALASNYKPEVICDLENKGNFDAFSLMNVYREKILRLKCLDDQVAVISVGKNSYGHPNAETIDLLKKYNIRIFRTDENGDIVIETDGKKVWLKEK